MSSETQSVPWTETLKDQGKKRGLLELWTGVLGNQMIESHAKEHARNRNAHGRFHRGQLGQTDDADEDMGNTILGDVTYPAPVVVSQSNGSGLLKAAAIAAIGAAIPGAGVAGYFLADMLQDKPAAVVPGQQNDNDFSVGLGKIEDYLNQ